MAISSSTTSLDQEKFLAARLIQRALIKVVCVSVCDPVKLPEGVGLTANFIRYNRMTVPLIPLTEGVTPPDNTFSLSTVTCTLVQWGDVLTLTDVAQLTTKHPLLQQSIELLSDNAQRVIDREIQIVWLSGTNIQYYDGTVTSRSNLTSGSYITDKALHKARTTLIAGGAPPRGGPAGGLILGNANAGANEVMREQSDGAPWNFGKKGGGQKGGEGGELNEAGDGSINQGQAYVLIVNQYVAADIEQATTTVGTWASVAMYNNDKALYNSEVGTWLGMRIVESNFLPIFQLLGNNTVVVASGQNFGTNTPTITALGAGGALNAGTYNLVITMKDQTRGFEEFISIQHTIVVGGAGAASVFIAFPVNTGFVYNVYFDSTNGGGGAPKLVQANIANNTTLTITANQAAGNSPPTPPPSNPAVNVHACYAHGAESVNLVALQQLQVYLTIDQATISDPLKQLRKMGYKMMFAGMIRDQARLLRMELASQYF